MKRSIKILGLALAATAAFSAFAAMSANAGTEFYFDGGETLPSSGTTSSSTLMSANATLTATMSGFKTVITCTAATAMGTLDNKTLDASSTPTGHATNVEAHLTNCTTSTGCLVHSLGAVAGTIQVNSMTGTPESATTTTFKPAAGGPFVTIVLEGASCPTPGEFPVTGTAMGTVENATGKTTFSGSTGSALKLGPAAATFTAECTQSEPATRIEQK